MVIRNASKCIWNRWGKTLCFWENYVDFCQKIYTFQVGWKYLASFHPRYLDFLGYAYFTAGRYEESVEAWKKSIDHFGRLVVREAFLAASYSGPGRNKEAKKIAQQLIEANSDFSLSSWKLAHMYKNYEDTERLLNALRKAGEKWGKGL